VKITLSELAAEEFERIAYFYRSNRDAKLSLAFIAELETTAELIAKNPLIGRKSKSETRWFALRRFPYKLIYLSRADEIIVIAIAHERRKPNYWLKSMA
jgi:toxin ParE1/3/4